MKQVPLVFCLRSKKAAIYKPPGRICIEKPGQRCDCPFCMTCSLNQSSPKPTHPQTAPKITVCSSCYCLAKQQKSWPLGLSYSKFGCTVQWFGLHWPGNVKITSAPNKRLRFPHCVTGEAPISPLSYFLAVLMVWQPKKTSCDHSRCSTTPFPVSLLLSSPWVLV